MLQPSKSRSGFGNGDRSIDGEVCLLWIAYTSRSHPTSIPPAICSPAPFSGRTGGISVLRRSVPSVPPAGIVRWTAIPLSSAEKSAVSSLSAQPTALPAVSAAGSSPPKSKSIKQHPVLFYPLKVSSWGSERPEKCPVGEALRRLPVADISSELRSTETSELSGGQSRRLMLRIRFQWRTDGSPGPRSGMSTASAVEGPPSFTFGAAEYFTSNDCVVQYFTSDEVRNFTFDASRIFHLL